MLIDDSLKRRVAIDGNVALKSAAIAKANELIDASFASDGKTGAATLREIGIDPMTVQSKFVSDLIWSDHLQRIYSDKFAGIENKIDVELARLKKNASNPQIKLSEIVLAPAPNRDLKQTLNLATQLVAAIRKGANFNAIAQQYSGAGSAKQGGRIGWLVANRLPPLFVEKLKITANGGPPIQLNLMAPFISLKKTVSENWDWQTSLNLGFGLPAPFFHYPQMQPMLTGLRLAPGLSAIPQR